jgi:nucleoid-associated protein EbfC
MAFNPFGQLGELKKMRDQAMEMQRELQAEIVEVSKRGVYVKISGDQKIIDLKTNDKSDDDIREAVNEAVKKSQEVAAKKMQSMMGGMGGLANMLGGGK